MGISYMQRGNATDTVFHRTYSLELKSQVKNNPILWDSGLDEYRPKLAENKPCLWDKISSVLF